MTHLCIFEDDQIMSLRPLIDLRAVYQLRPGILTLLDGIRLRLPASSLVLHARQDVASIVATATGYPVNQAPEGPIVCVNGRLLAEEGPELEQIRRLFAPDAPDEKLVQGSDLVAVRVHHATADLFAAPALTPATFEQVPTTEVTGARFVGRMWHLIDEIRPALVRDAAWYAPTRSDEGVMPMAEGVMLAGREALRIGPRVTLRPGVILNATTGPIVIDEDTTVMEGAIIRGPAYIGPRCVIKTRADLEAVSIGPGCKVGGEVTDTILHAHANKGHEGFLGHSFIGKWCNLGAGTTVSNLRNDYGEVSLYNPQMDAFEPSGRQFVGAFMADHTKTGIQSMVNTGSVFGVSCNLFGAGYLPRRVSSFTWGGPDSGYQPYRIEKALRVAEMVMARRNLHMTPDERERLFALYHEALALSSF